MPVTFAPQVYSGIGGAGGFEAGVFGRLPMRDVSWVRYMALTAVDRTSGEATSPSDWIWRALKAFCRAFALCEDAWMGWNRSTRGGVSGGGGARMKGAG